jgi:hypothetical protein
MFAPELKTPAANARSLFGNHSAIALTAAGKFADSPSPSANRAAPNPAAERVTAWAMAARLQRTMATE